MTPQEKAKELFDKMQFNAVYVYTNNCAKEHALIAVDEILNLDDFSIEGREYWREVKQEIEKL